MFCQARGNAILHFSGGKLKHRTYPQVPKLRASIIFIISVFLCFPIRKLCIVVLLGRPGKTKFEVNLSFAAKFRTTVKATSGNVTGLDWIRFDPQQ